jgi:hypothetical protein
MLIRLLSLRPVNPKSDGETCDRTTIGAILRPDDDENRAGLFLTKPRCFVEQECVDEVIDRSADFRRWSKLVGKMGGATIAAGERNIGERQM